MNYPTFHKLIDTNILYDAFTLNSNTKKAVEIIDCPVCISGGVLYELSNLLKNTVNSQFAIDTIQNILNTPEMFRILNSNQKQKNKALKIMQKYQTTTPKKDFSLCDSVQLIQAEEFKLTLFTLDERMTFYAGCEVVKPY